MAFRQAGVIPRGFKGCGLAENPRKGRLPLDPSLDDFKIVCAT